MTSRKVKKGGISHKKDNKARKSKENIQCYVCQDRGHYARECPQRKTKSPYTDRDESCVLIASYEPATSCEQGELEPKVSG